MSDGFGYEPGSRSAGGGGGGGGGGGNALFLTAGQDLTAGQPVRIEPSDGSARLPDGTEAKVAGVIGTVAADTPSGHVATVLLPGQVVPVPGASVGVEYFASGSSLVPWSGVPGGAWARSAGVATAAGKLAFNLGPPEGPK